MVSADCKLAVKGMLAILQNGARRVGSAGAHEAAARVGASTAQVKARHRGFVLGGAVGWTIHPPVIDGELGVMPVTASYIEL